MEIKARGLTPLVIDQTPTLPPQGQILYPQEGASGTRLTKKPNVGGVANPRHIEDQSTNNRITNKPDQSTNIKTKIRNLRLRYQQTGTTAKPKGPLKKPAGMKSEEISLTQAIREYTFPETNPQPQDQTPPMVGEPYRQIGQTSRSAGEWVG